MRHRPTPALLILLVLSVAVTLAACSGSTPEPLKVGMEAAGTSVELEKDQILEVSLEGNPTTGYAWEVKESGAPVLSQEGEPTYTEGATDGTLVGGGGTYLFTFAGAEAGTTTVELVYQRSWEDVEPLDTFTMDVTVK